MTATGGPPRGSGRDPPDRSAGLGTRACSVARAVRPRSPCRQRILTPRPGGTVIDEGAGTQAAPTAERRWPMAAAVLVAVLLQLVAPQAGRLAPRWLFPVLELVLLAVLMIRDP